jgi:hypothetical protein
VGKFRQRGERGVDERGARVPVDLRDEAETAAVVLERLVIEARNALLHHPPPRGIGICWDAMPGGMRLTLDTFAALRQSRLDVQMEIKRNS